MQNFQNKSTLKNCQFQLTIQSNAVLVLATHCEIMFLKEIIHNPERILHPSKLSFWTRWFLAVRACPVHCRMLTSITGLHPQVLLAPLHPCPLQATRNVSRHHKNSPRGQNPPWLRFTKVQEWLKILSSLF